MNADIILTHYWDIFISHLCEFYPLNKSFVDKYEYELDWNSLSKNKTLDWDISFLKKYESRFLWHELAWNESILWTEDRIDSFKKRLDWYYLGRNKNLPITDDFIQKYSKKISVIETNPRLTDALVKKHNLKVLPASSGDTQEIKSIEDDELESILNTFTFHHNQKVLYNDIFLPIINERKIEAIFGDKFDYTQRYYFLVPVHDDVSGLTPEFKIEDHNPFEQFREGRGLFEINEELTLVNGSLQEGPDRLYEVPRFTSFSFYTTLLVSENVRSIIEQFKLPAHKYHEVKLKPKKLTITTKFYLLQLDFDTLNKDLDYTDRKFYYSFKDFKKGGKGPVTDPITSHDELINVNALLKEKYSPNGYGVKIRPDKYPIKTDYDMYSMSVHKQIIVNQYLKDALEKNFPGQMTFKSAQTLNIKIDQRQYDSKAGLQINTKQSSKVSYRESEVDKFYYAKLERLEKDDSQFDSSLLENDKFRKKELELKVIFPKIFKNNYLNKNLSLGDYDLLPISKFYIQNEYSGRYPETYKSVVVAENGLGDTLSLMLERDSDYKLQNALFEFLHETGEYEEI